MGIMEKQILIRLKSDIFAYKVLNYIIYLDKQIYEPRIIWKTKENKQAKVVGCSIKLYSLKRRILYLRTCVTFYGKSTCDGWKTSL